MLNLVFQLCAMRFPLGSCLLFRCSVVAVILRQWGHSCGTGSPLHPQTGACSHKENQPGKMPDQHGWTIGEYNKYRLFPQPSAFFTPHPNAASTPSLLLHTVIVLFYVLMRFVQKSTHFPVVYTACSSSLWPLRCPIYEISCHLSLPIERNSSHEPVQPSQYCHLLHLFCCEGWTLVSHEASEWG